MVTTLGSTMVTAVFRSGAASHCPSVGSGGLGISPGAPIRISAPV